MNTPRHRKEQGLTLIVALVLLVALSVLGLWALSNNTLQERMAGNTRNRELALQGAEAALKDAEATVSTWIVQVFDNTNGLLTYDPSVANDAATWENRQINGQPLWGTAILTRTAAVTIDGLADQPTYVIEKLPNSAHPVSGAPSVQNFRVTARAVGGNRSAVVILQSNFQATP